MKKRDRLFAVTVLLLVVLALCSPLVGIAFASSDEATSYEYEVTISAPSGWFKDAAEVKVAISGDDYGTVEIQAPGERCWTDITGCRTYTVSANGTYTVRVTDPDGKKHEQSQAVECIDNTAPTVTAGIRDTLLHAEAVDTQSGVYGLMVDDKLYTTLENGSLDLRLADYADAGKVFSISAVDNLGNKSNTLSIENPYYVNSTPAPSPTPVIIYTGSKDEPTQSNSAQSGSARPTTQVTPVSAGTSQSSTAQTPAPTATPKPESSPVPEDDDALSTEEITIVPGTGFSASGNAATRDLLYDQYSNKQFITVQTRNGETFYLVIDYDKANDEDGESYETYFLNLVDEADLLALVDEDAIAEPAEVPEVCNCDEKCAIGSIDTNCPVCRTNLSECCGKVAATPQPEASDEPGDTESEQPSTGKGKSILALFLILAVGAGVGIYFLKNKKSMSKTTGSTDFDDYDFGEDDEDEEENDNDPLEGEEIE